MKQTAIAAAAPAPNPIRPEFTFRVSADEMRASHPSLDGAFEAGNYLLTAEYAELGSELEGCSLVLCGALSRGLGVLEALGSLGPRGLLCKAFAEWSLDRDDAARATLSGPIEDATYRARAEALLRLIGKQQLTVFATAVFLPVPGIAGASDSARAPEHRYGRFVVKTVGSQLARNAYDCEAHGSIDRLLAALPADAQPDFLYAMTPLWPPPAGLENVAIPKVLWCHDSDIALYRALDNLALYDVRIVNTSQEHFELSRATGGFCISNLISDPLNADFPPLRPPAAHKDLDVVFTGSAFDAFHTEKARFIYQLAALGDRYKVRVIDGHMPQAQYYDLLSRSKFLPIVNRYAGCPSPRWRDALANSAYVLHPQGTGYGKMFPGCFAFDPEAVARDVETHLSGFDAGKPAYDQGSAAQRLASEFAIFRDGRDKLIERQLKLAAFAALVLRPQPQAPSRPARRRLVWLTPCIDPFIYGRYNIRGKIARMAEAADTKDLADARDINNLAHVYAQLPMIFREAPARQRWEERAGELFAGGCARFPASLMLHFNRAQWLFLKDGAERGEAVALLRSLLERWEDFDFDPLNADIGFAYTLGDDDRVFPYYTYAQLVTSYAAGIRSPGNWQGPVDVQALRDVLKAAAHGYLGWDRIEQEEFEAGFEHIREALRLHKDNAPLLRFALEWRLEHDRRQPSPAHAGEVCDAFIACANIYPPTLLTHAHLVCPLFERAGRHGELRHVLASWYQLGNVTHSVNAAQRLHMEIDRLQAIAAFRQYFPERLQARLRNGVAGSDLTQFEGMVLQAADPRAAVAPTEGMILRGRRFARRAAAFVWWRGIRRFLTLCGLRPGWRRGLAVYAVRRLPMLDGCYEAFSRARFGEPELLADNPTRLQAMIFACTRRLYRR